MFVLREYLMAELDLYWFLALLFSPLVVCVIAFLSNLKTPSWTSWWTVLGTSMVLGISLAVCSQFKYDTVDQLGILDDDQFRARASLYERAKNTDFNPDYEVKSSFDWVTRVRWVPKFGIQFYLGMDGLNLGCILISNFAFFLATLSVWMKEKLSTREFPLVSLAQFGLTGALLSLDGFFLLFFLSIFLFAGYFLGWGFVPIGKRKLASIAGQLSTVSLMVFATIILFSVQSNMEGFTNPDEMVAAKNHLKRLHPDWDEQKIQDVLTSHSWNIMAYQRAGVGAIQWNKKASKVELKQSSWFSKKTQIMCFLLVAVASLGLVFSNFLLLLALESADEDYVLPAIPCSMMYGLIGIYLLTRIGFGMFPLGAALVCPVLAWVFLGLTGMASAYMGISKSMWSLPARFYLWAQFFFLLGLSTVNSLTPDVWNSKMFSGIFLWELSLCITVPLIVFLLFKIRSCLKLDVFEMPMGLWKTQPMMVSVVGLTLACSLGVPGSLGFLGAYSNFGAILSFGGILPFAAVMVFLPLVIRGLLKPLELLASGVPVGESKISFTIPEIIGVLLSFVILIGLGFFPNLLLSWYYPSTCAIYDLVQVASFK